MNKIVLLFLILINTAIYGQSWSPKNGSNDPQSHFTAFINANIFVDSETFISGGTLLIRKDKIEKVGKQINIPANTVIIDLKGKFIYPSFIDLHTQFGIAEQDQDKQKPTKPQLTSKKSKAYYWNETVKPETRGSELFKYDRKEAERFRKMGFGAVLSHQKDGVIRGTSVLVNLTQNSEQQLIIPESGMHYSFFKGKSNQTYPTSLMGMISLIRQAHYDAEWYSKNKTDLNLSLAALAEKSHLPKFIDAGSTQSILRAAKIADEFDFKFIAKGDGREYERLQEIKAIQSSLIVPIDFPKPFEVSDPYEAIQIPLSKLKAWELAPKNLGMLSDSAVSFAITADKMKNEKDFFENVMSSIDNGLKRSEAIKALTETPAQLIKADSLLGTITEGKLANFLICDDSLFVENSRVISSWVVGQEYSLNKSEAFSYEGFYSINVNRKLQFDLLVEKKKSDFSAKVKSKADTAYQKATLNFSGNRVSISFKIDSTLYRLSGNTNDTLSRIWSGKTILDSRWVDWAAIKKEIDKKAVKKKDSFAVAKKSNQASVFYPNMAFGWESLPEKAPATLFRNATLWTNEEDGILTNHDIFIAEGKIKMVGYKINMDVMFPEYAGKLKEIDATGWHITSGIIDEHSHIAIERGVNESGQAITSEVSIGDVVNSNDINIYRQLAGGVTASQLLHGSANPIGGQSALIKLRWGQSPEKMKIEDATGFIKFALGENVKQSNWGDQRTVRFPQTRMGVEQVFYDGFTRAEEYRAEWTIFNAKSKREKKKSNPPRTDLELQALVEILDTNRFITCHSYIQSEVNMLMHLADSMHFQINTFTHILEGYKVAEKLKQHGAAASTFSDWWAYKFEVNDAIPFNGAILHQKGVLTGFNSDDAEMGRRLNQEAAKAVKYGGVSEEEAWKFVTLNPAKMLHLDHRMGSLKAGKDADIVVWSDHPLSIYAKVKQTFIDGIPYYDEKRNVELQKRNTVERERIIGLMLAEKNKGKSTQKFKKEPKKLYECDTYGE